MAKTFNIDEIIEMAELAHESAMVELEQFGCIAFENGIDYAEFVDDESTDAAYEAYRGYRGYVSYELM